MRVIGDASQREYEKVVVDTWVEGIIEVVQYDGNRTYSVKDKETGEWSKATAPHVRFKFKLDGYQFPHYGRWMKASTNEKSNFYGKYLKPLCPTHDPVDCAIDLDSLTGVRVKTMWEDDGDYQRVTAIRPLTQDLDVRVEALRGESHA